MKLAIGTYVWHELPTVYLKPYGGTWLGHPPGWWSRRITREHRLVYRVKGHELRIAQYRLHY